MDLSSAYYTPYPCPGINITSVINKYICRGLIFAQDVTISTVVLNFQCLLLFLISHTSAMYHLMSEEMLALSRVEYSTNRLSVQKKLSLLIKRHSLLLHIVECLRTLYNMPIGVNFGTNAFCICMFFFLNLEAWITFGPLLGYCFLVFFLYCYLCQKLIDASEVFERAVYSCGWESYGLDDMKSLLIVLKQAQQPALLLAGYMIPVNIYTFATGMQFIYKFVTTLKV
ncbi:putative odorant receptor 85d [Aricia agestis]|uniref:putative odorant receptor 85d n=1 Tax=Aricia agestis TaxID=91739 RepID=UPI001C20B21B|nr:putative odorant receptor 85d [Aricia agestis]